MERAGLLAAGWYMAWDGSAKWWPHHPASTHPRPVHLPPLGSAKRKPLQLRSAYCDYAQHRLRCGIHARPNHPASIGSRTLQDRRNPDPLE